MLRCIDAATTSELTSTIAALAGDRCAIATMQGVSEVKFQVIRLMRMLVQICQTLETVPEEVRSCSLCVLGELLPSNESAMDLILTVGTACYAAVPVHEDELPRRHARSALVVPG